MNKQILVACLITLFTFSINAQDTSPSPKQNLVKAKISFSEQYGSGIGLGYERLLGARHYLGINAFSNFNNTYEGSLSYKFKFMRLGRISLLGGVSFNYTDVDYSHLGAWSGTSLSLNPLLEFRLKVTKKVDLTAMYNWRSTTLSHTGREIRALNSGWGLGVNVKF